MATERSLPFDPICEARGHWEAHGWADEAPGMAAVTSVMRVNQLLLARADALLRPFDVTFARYEVLMLLSFSRARALPLGKIGERLQVHPASVTNAVDRLESRGFVRRHRNPADGRGMLAEITPAGRCVAEHATRTLNEQMFSSLGLTADESDQLFSLLRTIRLDAGDFVA